MKEQQESFAILEKHHFFYERRERPAFGKIVEAMERLLGDAGKKRLEGLVLDIGVLLEGNVQHRRYPEAFARYTTYYRQCTPEELFRYCRFLCETFQIEIPQQQVILDSVSYASKK